MPSYRQGVTSPAASRSGPVDIHGLRTLADSTLGRTPHLDKQGRPTGKTLGQTTALALLDAVAETTGIDVTSVDHVCSSISTGGIRFLESACGQVGTYCISGSTPRP